MQKVSIRPTSAALQYARFLTQKGAIVKYLTSAENKTVLKIDMSPCKLRARRETPEENKEADAGPKTVN